MIQCDAFESAAAIISTPRPTLRWSFWTDLPAGTVVSLDVSRLYVDHSGDERLWTMHDAAVAVLPNAGGDFGGAHGDLDILKADL